MRIAQVAPLYERVPPVAYGGTERVVSYLTEELERRGHDVSLFASGDSITSARLYSGCEQSLRTSTCADPLAHHIRMLGELVRRQRDFDIIHCHADYLCFLAARLMETPTLVTLHGRLDLPDLPPLYDEYADVPLVAISDDQRSALPAASWVATVHHGVPPDLFPYSASGGEHLLFLGRICPEKKPDVAIRVARETGVPLRIAAKVDAVDRDYFDEIIKPLLRHPLVDFIGEVGDREKAELLGTALALIFPIDWPEPFGLVMIESLACGTPVIARRRGSVSEILRHGETAWLCETEDEMLDAVERIRLIDRSRCRAAFDSRFTTAAMTDCYVEVYDRILRNARPTRLTTMPADRSASLPVVVSTASEVASRPRPAA